MLLAAEYLVFGKERKTEFHVFKGNLGKTANLPDFSSFDIYLMKTHCKLAIAKLRHHGTFAC